MPQVTSCGLVTDTVEVSTEHTRSRRARKNPGRQSGDDGKLRVVRIAQYPEMACFLVRDFPLGRRPHKAIPQVVGQRGLEEEFVVKVQGSGRKS